MLLGRIRSEVTVGTRAECSTMLDADIGLEDDEQLSEQSV